MKHNHIEEFLRLLGFLKDKSLSRWSCYTNTRVPISLIDTAILECHRCYQITQQRAVTIKLVNKHKKDRQHLDISQIPTINLVTPQRSEETSDSNEVSHSFKENEDYLQLYELIWGITHTNNDDREAKHVLLLSYPLVTKAKYE